ncbi:MAG TPA: hypothetical protein VGJ70_04850 [Solirubrobacteraceae bacterium]|jgi:hypothetical protein
MASVAAPFALLVALLNAAAAAAGAWRWWRGLPPAPSFWWLVRAGQAAAVVLAALAGVLALTGERPGDGLFWLYVALPPAVALIAEQLRIASAQAELDARGLPDAQAMRGLAQDEQHAIVAAILRREMVVMTCACGVVVFLALRAAGTA